MDNNLLIEQQNYKRKLHIFILFGVIIMFFYEVAFSMLYIRLDDITHGFSHSFEFISNKISNDIITYIFLLCFIFLSILLNIFSVLIIIYGVKTGIRTRKLNKLQGRNIKIERKSLFKDVDNLNIVTKDQKHQEMIEYQENLNAEIISFKKNIRFLIICFALFFTCWMVLGLINLSIYIKKYRFNVFISLADFFLFIMTVPFGILIINNAKKIKRTKQAIEKVEAKLNNYIIKGEEKNDS